MKTTLLVLVLLAITVSASLDPVWERCGKQNDGAVCQHATRPCCSKIGFCGNRQYHCLTKYGCQSGCRPDPLTNAKAKVTNKSPTTTVVGAPNAAALVGAAAAGSPAKAVAAAAVNVSKTIIKTVMTPIPTVPVSAEARIVSPSVERKIEEETSETVTESSPPPEKEPTPSCDSPDCKAKEASSASTSNTTAAAAAATTGANKAAPTPVPSSATTTTKVSHGAKKPQQEQQQQQKKKEAADAAKARQIVINVTGRKSGRAGAYQFTFGNDPKTKNVLDPEGY